MVRPSASGEQGSHSREETWQRAQDLVFGSAGAAITEGAGGGMAVVQLLLTPQREDSKGLRALSSH